jgi:hypothetical protein
LILTSDENNHASFAKPENYDPARFKNYVAVGVVTGIQNQKVGYNGGRLIGTQIGYPEGTWEEREKISQEYLDFILQELWYLKNDAPEEIREQWKRYGLAKDEFVDNSNLPYEIYVREARRIVGPYVFTEHDNIPKEIERTKIHFDSVAMTDWPIDSVACRERTVPDGNYDGIVFLAESSRPAQIPYRCILPKSVDNLIVPLCISASHVGWGSIRLEPVWMQLGEAAGYAVTLSLENHTGLHDVNPDLLLRRLIKNGFEVTFLNDQTGRQRTDQSLQYFGTRGFFRDYDARPDEVLTEKTAVVWIEILKRILQEHYSRTVDLASRLPTKAKDRQETPITWKQFVCCLVKEIEISQETVETKWKEIVTEGSSDKTITRGEVCLLLYSLTDSTK